MLVRNVDCKWVNSISAIRSLNEREKFFNEKAKSPNFERFKNSFVFFAVHQVNGKSMNQYVNKRKHFFQTFVGDGDKLFRLRTEV